MKKTALVIGGVCILLGLALMISAMSYKNTEVRLVKEYEAQSGKIEAVHDAMWKIIQQKAGVTKEYAAQFDSIYTHIMDARYQGSDGVLFEWIKESNPEFDPGLYKDLSVTIEVQRKAFLGAQEKIIDIVREHNTLIETYPSRWFLGGCLPLEYEPITSTYSKEVMETRLDNEIGIF